MNGIDYISINEVIKDIKELICYSNKVGYFFGAGTSCSLGIPAIKELTNLVESSLDENLKNSYFKIKEDITKQSEIITIEDVLNHTRQIRALTSDCDTKSYIGISGLTAKKIDLKICNEIYNIISGFEKSIDYTIVGKFFSWLNLFNCKCSKEIFTPNYDLVLEKSLEKNSIPYFDGFVGAFEPFFYSESVEKEIKEDDITKNWIRIWKLHGSLNWFWKSGLEGEENRIVRANSLESATNEIVIYPSRDKYELSRKQPFLTYFDRLRSYLNAGESLLIVSGYSFADQHINEIIFNALRQNQFLNIVVFAFTDEQIQTLQKYANQFFNLYVLGPGCCLFNGRKMFWKIDESSQTGEMNTEYFWDESMKKCKLGNFCDLINFLASIFPNKGISKL